MTRWGPVVGAAVAAVLSLAAVAVTMTSVSGPGDVERIRAAVHSQTNCVHLSVHRPSSDAYVKRWTPAPAQSADIVCATIALHLTYAHFNDRGGRDRAVGVLPPSNRYCLLGSSIVVDRLARTASTALSDLCQSLGGRLVIVSPV